jgi:hypothetical protein
MSRNIAEQYFPASKAKIILFAILDGFVQLLHVCYESQTDDLILVSLLQSQTFEEATSQIVSI